MRWFGDFESCRAWRDLRGILGFSFVLYAVGFNGFRT